MRLAAERVLEQIALDNGDSGQRVTSLERFNCASNHAKSACDDKRQLKLHQQLRRTRLRGFQSPQADFALVLLRFCEAPFRVNRRFQSYPLSRTFPNRRSNFSPRDELSGC